MNEQTRREWLHTVGSSAAALALSACGRRPGPADVCVVGSGPAGAILACALAERGITTLLLEGGANPAPSTAGGDGGNALLPIGQPLRYPVENTRFLGDGGTSNLWGGECPRFQPWDFAPDNPHLPADVAWPLRYDDIEPYYFLAEKELSIAGGVQSRYSPPRSSDFPARLDADSASDCLRETLALKGWTVEDTPRSLSPRVAQTHLPRFMALPTARFQRLRVRSVVMGPDGRVSHLEASDAQGNRESVAARFYVLACGGVETPRLLLHSRDRNAPDGIGNAHGVVGRHFMEHLAVEVGHFSLPTAVPCAGRGSGISWQFSSEFKSRGLGNAVFEFALSPDSVVHVSAVFGMRPLPTNRVTLSATERDSHGDPTAEVTLAIGESERQAWEHVRTVGRRVAAALRARSEVWSDWNVRWTHHHMGTCRMGTDPETSVCDASLRIHNVDNLYVSGSAPFVTCGAGSPTLLLSALTLRLADHLATRVGAGSRA